MLGSDSEAELLQETSEISHDPDALQGDGIREGDLDESSHGDSVVDKPDTSQKNNANKPDSGDIGNGVSDTDKVVTENDDCVLALDTNVSQNDDTVLDNDENDSDLLKEDDDEEETELDKKKKESLKNNVSDGKEKTEDGVD